MREAIHDHFYELIRSYKNCVIDYCLIEDDVPHKGYRSHKDAVLFAMCKVIERYIEQQLRAEIELGSPEEEPFPWRFDIGQARAERIDPLSFLYVPHDRVFRDAACGGQIPYWYAFLETPHESGYGPDDLVKINEVLFPNGAGSLEVYEWSTDWSNYFDDGHEWWGAACWSIYDSSLDRYAVMMASTTD